MKSKKSVFIEGHIMSKQLSRTGWPTFLYSPGQV